MRDKSLQTVSDRKSIDQFLNQVKELAVPQAQQGRLIFALDATASRKPTWDQACQLQSELFLATQDLGGLAVQLCYYRGFGEFVAAPWLSQTQPLLQRMNGVDVLGGHTQIRKVLRHAVEETRKQRVSAVVFIGDCCEEAVDDLCQLAGELGLLRTPVFIFQEGQDNAAEQAFRQISHLSGGAYAPFDLNSPGILKDLLAAVAIYATGGPKALEQHAKQQGQHVKLLTRQMT
ncbi:VWA domain-containing protein [Salinispirillum marinum]|uniref:VWA domain-containing protein n=2 Tax=Saccharospirillaceae TaxID=255527 RepID=A0ABV8BJ83_9GAMM